MKKLSVLFIGLFVSYNCYAGNAYIGAGIGQAKLKDAGSCTDLSGLFDPGYLCNIDDSDTSYNLFAGYTFMPNISGELGYIDLGKYNISASGTVIGTPVSVSGDFKAKGWTVSVVGTLPIQPNFLVLGRLGLFQWDGDLSISAASGATTVSGSESASGTDPLFGVGLQWNVTNKFSVRGEWTRYKNIGDQNTTGQSDIDNLSLNALYNF
jgi:OOP family OmpA-OmpF porin